MREHLECKGDSPESTKMAAKKFYYINCLDK